ncbi:MAG: GAD-like domain-containing protein [Paracoccaceae bacterium]
MKFSDLNEDYQWIANRLGQPMEREPFSVEDLAYMSERLPPRLVEFMEYSGKAIYQDGAVTVCNPREMAPILAMIFKADPDLSHKDCTVVSYSAFGDLKLWSGQHRNIGIRLAEGELQSIALAPVEFAPGLVPKAKTPPDPNRVAAGTIKYKLEHAEFLDYAGEPMFARCLSTHGRLALGECYGFFPALALVGMESPMRRVEQIRKVRALEHFAILAQMQPFILTTVGRNGVERLREIG